MNEILIILVLIFLNGLFSMSEIALISARKSRLSSDAKNGDKGAKTALGMAEHPDKFLSTVQIGITLIGILTGIFSGATIATRLSHWFESMGVSMGYAMTIAQTAIVIIVTYLTLIFGELLPKRIGMSMSERIAKMMSRPMNLLSKIVSPFVLLLSESTSILFKLMGLKNESTKVTEDEIKSIVQEGAEDGVVQPVEQDLVERVFMMGDLNVDSIMTQRNDLVWFDVSMKVEEVRQILSETLFEFYPVIERNFDKLVGIVTLKQLVLYLNDPNFNIRNILTEPAYFYENTKVYKVMEIMKEAHVSRGIVVDEFGTCIGIVTLKDIIEGLFGSMPEEHEDPQIVKRDNGEGWLIDGSCTMLNFLTYFNEEDKMVDEGFNTVAGLCINQLRHIPKPGEHFNWKKFCFEIVDLDHAKIDTILVNRI